MKIVTTYTGEYKDMVNSYYNLENYNDNSNDDVLFQGYSSSTNQKLKDDHGHFKKRRYINLEAPCSFTSTLSSVDEQAYFTHVYSICPYTCQWLNEKIGNLNIPIPFPFNIESFKHIKKEEKENDVMYMGTLMCDDHRSILDVMKKYKSIYTSLQNHEPPYNPTHVNIHSSKKWELLSKSKVSIAMNLAPIVEIHKTFIRKYDGWDKNEAFSYLDTNYIPQFKPRVIESMVCKTLVLVMKDDWNVIENWFTPDEHFIYFDGFSDLDEKIHDIINNYEKYNYIIENAYKKVMEYEIKNIYNNLILKN